MVKLVAVAILTLLNFSIEVAQAQVDAIYYGEKIGNDSYRLSFTDPNLWKGYQRWQDSQKLNQGYVNLYSIVGGISGTSSLIECVPKIQRKGEASSFSTCKGIEYQKGAASFVLSGRSSSIYGFKAYIAAGAANNSWLPSGYFTDIFFRVQFTPKPGETFATYPKCKSSVGSFNLTYPYTGYIRVPVMASKMDVWIRCTHPINHFDLREAGWYFAQDATPYRPGTEERYVGPIIQTLDVDMRNPNVLNLVADTLSADGKVITQANIANPSGKKLTTYLGTYGSLALYDGSGEVIPAKYQLQGATFSPKLTADELKATLNPSSLLVMFAKDKTLQAQQYVANHLGAEYLLVTPSDARFKPFQIQVNVAKPAALGSTDYDCSYKQGTTVLDQEFKSCNQLIFHYAHITGIPPQFIKAEIYQESYRNSFKKDSYRYEPTYDRAYFHNLGFKGVKFPLKANPLYKKFVFRADGHSMSVGQIFPRSIYKVLLPSGKLGNIPDNYERLGTKYTPLLGWDLVDADVNKLGNSQRWLRKDSETDEYIIKPEIKNFNFVAQTAVSSSYGMMQLMYATAADDMKYQVNGEGKDPVGLFRPKVNIELGSKYLVKMFKRINTIERNEISSFASAEAYFNSLKLAFAGYNGGESGYNYKDPKLYKEKVFLHSRKFWVSVKSVFQ